MFQAIGKLKQFCNGVNPIPRGVALPSLTIFFLIFHYFFLTKKKQF